MLILPEKINQNNFQVTQNHHYGFESNLNLRKSVPSCEYVAELLNDFVETFSFLKLKFSQVELYTVEQDELFTFTDVSFWETWLFKNKNTTINHLKVIFHTFFTWENKIEKQLLDSLEWSFSFDNFENANNLAVQILFIPKTFFLKTIFFENQHFHNSFCTNNLFLFIQNTVKYSKKIIATIEYYQTDAYDVKKFLNDLLENKYPQIDYLRDLSQSRHLLIREQIELSFLEKIQSADSLEALQSIENELNNTATDVELIQKLLKYVREKQAFY